MFCYQCEQTSKSEACKAMGVCGKDPKVAALQDLLLYLSEGISMYAHRARQLGKKDLEVDRFVLEALFSTVTNVNFDEQRLEELIKKADKMKAKAKSLIGDKIEDPLKGPASLAINYSSDNLLTIGETVSIEKRMKNLGPDLTGLQELITYGLKGMAAYADHAMILGIEDDEIYAFFHKALNFLTEENKAPEDYLTLALEVGEKNLRVMELLDRANTETYGHPIPSQVRTTPVKGKAILVSGHDLKDLENLLKQTEGKGVNIYTHGEMLPCHAYPELKKYKHLIGNYGGAWQDQRKEFESFPGSILMTTNCIQKPKDSYKNRIFTTGLVAWPEVQHTPEGNFAKVIEAALKEEGFPKDEEEKTILVGFGHNAVMSVAGDVIAAVKKGDIKHFFLIGGCDGAKPGRNYYTEFAEKVPKDSVILTLACGKYRFNKLEFGDINGIPRLLDIGQCNDAYSAIQIAVALSKAFDTDVNSLPLSMILSWYEQKAVCILLTLLHLGIKNIRLGPSLPAFITPDILAILVDKFQIKPISTVDEDLNAILGGQA